MTYLISLIFAWLLVRFQIFKPPKGQFNCGIFGFNGSRPVDITKLRWLAAENQSRGTDSTGVYGNHLYKEKGPAKVVMLMPGFQAATKGAATVQGHARSASPGSTVNKENAHPFMYGHEEMEGVEWKTKVVGAHNGFLIPEMLKWHEDHFGFKKYFPVDSQVIFAALAKTGDVNAISKIEGAMALSFQFLNETPNRLYLYKRAETRPLFIGEAPDGIYYSSLEDALKFIGCRAVWALNPDMLYTLENGEIIDVYKMPSPTLKSLAANVTRGSWRHGLPVAEVDALPQDVISTQTRTNACGTGKNRSDLFGNYRGFTKNNQSVSNRLGNDYKDKTSLDAKFNMLIKEVDKELATLEAFDLQPSEISSREPNELSSCALVVKVVKQDNNKGMPAWAVIADGDTELSGLTSGNGLTVIAIPPEKCKKEIEFLAYAPVEEYGPYRFKLKPEAARVMEVTLSIPFLQKGIEKESSPFVDTQPDGSENRDGGGQAELDLSSPSSKQKELHVSYKRTDSSLLFSTAPKFSWGHSEQSVDGVLDYSDPLGTVIPNSDIAEAIGPSHEERVKNSIFKLKEGQRKAVTTVALETDRHGKYIAFPTMPNDIVAELISDKGRAKWYQFFTDNYFATLRVSELVLDATRLQSRDRFVNKIYFPFWVYMEILLTDRFCLYVRDSIKDLMTLKPQDYLPSTHLKKTTITATHSSETTGWHPAYLVYVGFLSFLLGKQSSRTMTETEKSTVARYQHKVGSCLSELSDMLTEDNENYNLTKKQRTVLINIRNLLKMEHEDLGTYLNQLYQKDKEVVE